MDEGEIKRCFTQTDGGYRFARWGRPIAPVVFGVDDATLPVIKGAVEAVVTLADHRMAELDPELGANLLIFFIRDWAELAEAPDLDRLIPDLHALVRRLAAREANQYRAFRFDEAGAIQAAFVFIRMDKALMDVPAEDIALAQAAQVMVLWAEGAFDALAPLVKVGEAVMLNPDVAQLIRAAYDPVMPAAATDPSHALRLAARLQTGSHAAAGPSSAP